MNKNKAKEIQIIMNEIDLWEEHLKGMSKFYQDEYTLNYHGEVVIDLHPDILAELKELVKSKLEILNKELKNK